MSLSSSSAGAAFHRHAGEGEIHYAIRPARPSLAFQAAAWLLAGLFGPLVLLVLLDPTRRDGLSLLAAAGGAGVAVLAAMALRRARRGRGTTHVRITPDGLQVGAQRLPWQAGLGVRLAAPEESRHARAGQGAVHGLAARIAAQQQAAEYSLWLENPSGATWRLAAGLDAATAGTLREALLRDLAAPPRP